MAEAEGRAGRGSVKRAIRADAFGSWWPEWSALNLETSRCRRMLNADGSLTEVVRLDGLRGSLTDAELEKFVQSFPVQTI